MDLEQKNSSEEITVERARCWSFFLKPLRKVLYSVYFVFKNSYLWIIYSVEQENGKAYLIIALSAPVTWEMSIALIRITFYNKVTFSTGSLNTGLYSLEERKIKIKKEAS